MHVTKKKIVTYNIWSFRAFLRAPTGTGAADSSQIFSAGRLTLHFLLSLIGTGPERDSKEESLLIIVLVRRVVSAAVVPFCALCGRVYADGEICCLWKGRTKPNENCVQEQRSVGEPLTQDGRVENLLLQTT